jgi:hypothetical protein
MNYLRLLAFLLFAFTVVALPASAEDKGSTATITGFGASLAAPDPTAKIYDYVLTVGVGSDKLSFRIICDETKILDPEGKPVTDRTCGAVEQALNQSVEVTYVKGEREPFRAIRVKCLEQ